MRKLIIVLLVSASSAAWADTVSLKDGTVLWGKIKGQTAEKIIFEYEPGKYRTISRSQVENIQENDFKFPAQEKPSSKPDESIPQPPEADDTGKGRSAPPAPKPGSPLAVELEKEIDGLIRKVEAEERKAPKFNSDRFDSIIKALSPEALAAIQRLTELKEKLAALQMCMQCARYFTQKDFVYPCLGEVNPDADGGAFAAAAGSLTPQQIQKFEKLATSDVKIAPKAAAFTLLMGAAGAFVQGKGKFNDEAFAAADANLDAAKLNASARYFTDKMEAAHVLLRASGRFVGPDKKFDTDQFNAVLTGITQEKVDYVNAKLKTRNTARAVDLLLRP